MIFRLVAVLSAFGIALFAGCASSTRPAPATPSSPVAPAHTGEPVPSETRPAGAMTNPPAPEATTVAHKKPMPAPPNQADTTGATLQPGEYALMVTSEPSGATAVVNGMPSGKTPCRVIVQANARGFLRERISVKVRFIAADEHGLSQTVEDVLTTLDKVPTEIRFTAGGATRVVR